MSPEVFNQPGQRNDQPRHTTEMFNVSLLACLFVDNEYIIKLAQQNWLGSLLNKMLF